MSQCVSDLLPTDVELDIPQEVAVCPYCKAKLVATFGCWTLHQEGEWAGKWKAEEIWLDCINEETSGIDHYHMPYVYQLPVDGKVLAWVNENYSFDIDDD